MSGLSNYFNFFIALAILFLYGPSLSSQTVTISEIAIQGNNRTKNYIILRELSFSQGDTVSESSLPAKLEQSRLNLLNTSLFNFVSISNTISESSHRKVSIHIKVQERWYMWPKPVLQLADRNLNVWWLQKDFSRLNAGLGVDWENVTGRLDKASMMFQLGKIRNMSVSYYNPFIDKRKKSGLGFLVGYSALTEIGAKTENDKLIYFSSESSLTEHMQTGLLFTYEKSPFVKQQFQLSYHHVSFNDTLLVFNPDFSYPDGNELNFIKLYYKLKIDYRDIHYYPLKGWYADMEFSKEGLGFKFENPVNIAWIKSTSRIYQPLGGRWYSGASFMSKVSSKHRQPYFFMQGLGYGREFVRGYQYNVVDGKHFVVFKTTFKYAILKEKQVDLKKLRLPKFTRFHIAAYLTAFADAGYVWKPEIVSQSSNNLPGTWISAAGLGADIVTYYDKVVRFEYAITKSRARGFFIHFISGI